MIDPALTAELRQRRDALPDDEDMVFLTRDVPVHLLAHTYPLGIFPWPFEEDQPIPWVCPFERAILRFDRFRLGRSSRRGLDRAGFRVTFNEAFSEVINRCATVPGRDSWIFGYMREAYTGAHEAGFAESVEVWRDDELVGGLYGIRSPGFFSGESMFHSADHAGKAAVQAMVTRLTDAGHHWMDIQQLTPHMIAMGAEAIDRTAFLRLADA